MPVFFLGDSDWRNWLKKCRVKSILRLPLSYRSDRISFGRHFNTDRRGVEDIENFNRIDLGYNNRVSDGVGL